MNPIAYRLRVGSHDHFYHPGCLAEVDRQNVNSLTQEQLEQYKQYYTQLFSWDDVPMGVICSYHDCHRPIRDKSPFESQGDWNEVFERNERVLHALEERVLRNRHKELILHNEVGVFLLGKGRPTLDRWYLNTPTQPYAGDTMEEALREAEQEYPALFTWLDQFKDQ